MGWALYVPLVTLVQNSLTAAVFLLGGRMVMQGKMSGSDFAAFMVFSEGVQSAIGSIADQVPAVMSAMAAGEKVFQLMALRPTIPSSSGPGRGAAPSAGPTLGSLAQGDTLLSVKGVSFSYAVRAWGGYAPLAFSIGNQFCVAFLYGRAGRLTAQNGGFRPGQHTQRIEEIKPGDDPAPYGSLGRGAPVLKGMNLTIQVGEMVALVGLSGSGKTSLVSLILRFYDATSGAIELGGVPITALQPNHLRARIATVPQEPALFSVSMHDNIAYGMTGVSREKVEAAAKLSNAFDFISTVRARRGRLSALSGFL